MKTSDFSKSSGCTSRTKDVVLTKTASNRFFDEAIIFKDYCKDIIAGDCEIASKDELFDEVMASYTDANIDDIEETQEGYAKKLTNKIYRYYRSEKRKTVPGKRTIILPEEAFRLDLTDMVEVDFEGAEDIECRIDAIDNYSEKSIIEGIVYKQGLPKLGKTATAYHNVHNEIPLQLMRLALRQYADTILQEGESVNIIASYYYGAKTADRSDSAYLDDYFGESCPIRSLSEKYTKLPKDAKYGSEQYPYSDEDKNLIELLSKWATGYEKCDLDEEKDCKSCKDYWICHYEVAPTPLTEEKSIKKREKCVLSDEQQLIVDSQAGVFICNAVPGSGKTETAIKQRTVSIILNELADIEKRYLAGEDIKIEESKTSEWIKDSGTHVSLAASSKK